MHTAIRREWAEQPLLAEQLYASLLKAAFFDIALTVDSYASADKMALQASQDRYSRALRGANDGLWEWHVEDDYLYVSERWSAMLGLDSKHAPMSFEGWADLMPEAQRLLFRSAVQAHLEGRQAFVHVECQLRDSWGQLVWVLIRGVVSTDLYGKRLLAGSQTDISQRKQAE